MYYNSTAIDFLEENSCSTEVLIFSKLQGRKLLRPQNLSITKGMVMKTAIMATICSFFLLRKFLILKFGFDIFL